MREIQQLSVWREAALRLEQENAKLRDLNNVSLVPQLTYITGTVMADSGSPFRQSVLLNVGRRDGITDGFRGERCCSAGERRRLVPSPGR